MTATANNVLASPVAATPADVAARDAAIAASESQDSQDVAMFAAAASKSSVAGDVAATVATFELLAANVGTHKALASGHNKDATGQTEEAARLAVACYVANTYKDVLAAMQEPNEQGRTVWKEGFKAIKDAWNKGAAVAAHLVKGGKINVVATATGPAGNGEKKVPYTYEGRDHAVSIAEGGAKHTVRSIYNAWNDANKRKEERVAANVAAVSANVEAWMESTEEGRALASDGFTVADVAAGAAGVETLLAATNEGAAIVAAREAERARSAALEAALAAVAALDPADVDVVAAALAARLA